MNKVFKCPDGVIITIMSSKRKKSFDLQQKGRLKEIKPMSEIDTKEIDTPEETPTEVSEDVPETEAEKQEREDKANLVEA